MELIELKPEHIPQLTHLLNHHLHLITPPFSLSEQKVQSVVFSTYNTAYFTRDWNPPRQYGIYHHHQLIAAAQWEIPRKPNLASLLWFAIAQPNYPQAIQLLIDTFLKQTHKAGCNEIILEKFEFGVGWVGIPEPWDYLHQALTKANFWVHETWGIWTGSINDILTNPVKPQDNLTLSWDINPQKREYDLFLHRDRVEIGMCSAWGLPDTLDDDPTASQWMTIEYVEVKPDYRRHKIAKFMLQEQARYHARHGIQNFIVWIQQKNTPAINFAHSMGFTQQFLSHDYNYTRDT